VRICKIGGIVEPPRLIWIAGRMRHRMAGSGRSSRLDLEGASERRDTNDRDISGRDFGEPAHREKVTSQAEMKAPRALRANIRQMRGGPDRQDGAISAPRRALGSPI
jgi:hypothetical protein